MHAENNFSVKKYVSRTHKSSNLHPKFAQPIAFIISSKKLGQTELIKLSNQCFSTLFCMPKSEA